MSMYDISLIVFKPEAVGNLESYANRDGFDNGFIEEKYVLDPVLLIRRNMLPGESIEMDWGSTLYVVDRAELLDLFKEENITEVQLEKNSLDENDHLGFQGHDLVKNYYDIPISDLPVRDKYGIFLIEIY